MAEENTLPPLPDLDALTRILNSQSEPQVLPGWAVASALALIAHVRALRAENERLRHALEKIARIPAKPFPDPGAHSWKALAEAVGSAWSDMHKEARAALAASRRVG